MGCRTTFIKPQKQQPKKANFGSTYKITLIGNCLNIICYLEVITVGASVFEIFGDAHFDLNAPRILKKL